MSNAAIEYVTTFSATFDQVAPQELGAPQRAPAAAAAVSPSRANSGGGASSRECGICLDNYQANGDHVPRILPCGHTFCTLCIINLANAALCPECRAVIGNTADISRFQINYALIA